jgi:hypothetical protein
LRPPCLARKDDEEDPGSLLGSSSLQSLHRPPFPEEPKPKIRARGGGASTPSLFALSLPFPNY